MAFGILGISIVMVTAISADAATDIDVCEGVSMCIRHTTPVLKLPGESYEVRCPGSFSRPLENNMIQFRRMGYVYNYTRNRGSFTYRTGPGGHPISNWSTLWPDLEEATDRYSVSLDSERNSYVLRIDDLQPEDTTFYGCRIYNQSFSDGPENDTSSSMETTDLYVPGPLNGINFYWRNETGVSFDPIEEHSTFSVHEDTIIGLGCVINNTNRDADTVRIFLVEDDTEEDIKNKFLESRITTIGKAGDTSGLMHVRIENVYTDSSFKMPYTNNMKEFHCMGENIYNPPKESFITFDVTFGPKEAKCDPDKVEAPEGTKDAKLECQIRANPELNETLWKNATGDVVTEGGRFSIQNRYEGDMFYSTLTISEVVKEDYGPWSFTGQNEFGWPDELASVALSAGKVIHPHIMGTLLVLPVSLLISSMI